MKIFSYKKIFAALLALCAVGLFGVYGIAKANPSYFTPVVSSATATGTVSYMTPGTATTTLTLDSYYVNSAGTPTKADSAVLLTQFTGSSTSSVLGIALEYSQDGIDWYSDALNSNNSTTTPGVWNISTRNAYSWTFSNTQTIGGAGGTLATTTRAVNIQTPTRFVRAVYSITGANGAIWEQFVPAKERAENR